MTESIKRGAIILCRFPTSETSVQSGMRPAVVLSNEKANAKSPVITVVPLTGADKKSLPVHTVIKSTVKKSIALAEQLTVVDVRSQVIKILGAVTTKEMNDLERAVKVQLAI